MENFKFGQMKDKKLDPNYSVLPLCLVVCDNVYSFLAPFQVPPFIYIAVIMEQNNCKILWTKLKLKDSGYVWGYLKYSYESAEFSNVQKSIECYTFWTIVSTFSFCLIPTGIANKLWELPRLTWKLKEKRGHVLTFGHCFFYHQNLSDRPVTVRKLLTT